MKLEIHICLKIYSESKINRKGAKKIDKKLCSFLLSEYCECKENINVKIISIKQGKEEYI